MSYCIYLRKSRADVEAEARGEGETLARHKKILLDLARKMKTSITKVYSEVESGETIAARPIMQQLLKDVENGLWKGVLVVEVERLARGDTIDQGIVAQAFKYTNTKIITPLKTYDPANEFDEEYFEFGLFMSRREYKTINRRLQQGRISSVKEGKYLGTKPPYGYLRKKLEKGKGYTLEINPEQADIVKLIFELYTNNIGVSLIVRRLNNMKAPTMKGGDWVNATIQGILKNPVYIGKIRWNSRPERKKVVDGEIITERPRANEEDWIIADGLHESIIDDETFNLAQSILSKNPTPPVPRAKTIKNPLASLVICGKCGRKMSRRPYSNKQPDSLICQVTSCDNISSYLYVVEDKLLLALEEWLNRYKLDMKAMDNNSHNDLEQDLLYKAYHKVDEEIKTLETQLDSLHDLLEQGVYSTDMFLKRNKTLGDRIQQVENDKKALEKQIEQISMREKSRKVIIPKIEKVLELYHTIGDPAIKNNLLKEVIEKAIYTKTVGGRWHNKPDDFELVIYPNIPI